MQSVDQLEVYIYCCSTESMLVAIPLSSYFFDAKKSVNEIMITLLLKISIFSSKSEVSLKLAILVPTGYIYLLLATIKGRIMSKLLRNAYDDVSR